MNRYEAILLDKMVEKNELINDCVASGASYDHYIRDILLLLDCICDFREPPRALDVADGYGALATVDMDGEVVA